jgi:hypothetical protein
MTRYRTALALVFVMSLSSCDWIIGTERSSTIIDHEATSVSGLSEKSITAAKDKLDIVYWHTSHGSQITDGMAGMDAFYGGKGWYTRGGTTGLSLAEQSPDVGAFSSFSAFHDAVVDYLAGNPGINVVMASWCGQVSTSTEGTIDDYLATMDGLEGEYPDVRFVYMTGHADGTGLTGNLHICNQQIRDYCEANDKWLYDFYDIECYDPDGAYYGDRNVDDGCNYTGGNWATEWQTAHPGEWWTCGAQHSLPLNSNQKARAAWNLWVRLARDL